MAFGFLTPVAAVLVTAVMLGAIVMVHWSNGLWVTNGGLEYPLVLLTVAAVLGLVGPGAYALDAYVGWQDPAVEIYLIGLGLAVLGVIGLKALSYRGTTSKGKATT